MKPIPKLLGSLSILLVSSLSLSLANAATITPNILTDPDIGADLVNCSVRYAVEAVNLQDNTTVPGCSFTGTFGTDDTIVLGEGTYVLTIEGNGENGNQTGDLDIDFEFGFPLTLQGAGSNLTTIDASGIPNGDRILDSLNEGDLTITGLALTGGDANGADGGAFNINETTVTARDLLITGNRAGQGGGISYDGDDFEGDLMTLEDSTVDCNFAEGSITSGNGASCGGGIENEDGMMAVINSTISNNNSETGIGGGICDLGNYLFLINSTVSTNTALTEGGGIYTSGGLKGAYNVTITLNNAREGGGLFKESIAQGGGPPFDDPRFFTAQIFNTIVANNTALTGADCIGPYQTGGNNLIGQIGPNDNCTNFVDGANGDQVGTDTAPIDPLLGPLTDNGGPTDTHALLLSSTAIDRGNPDGCEALDVAAFNPDNFDDPLTFFTLTEDQRGLIRPVAILDPNVPVCDIGAFEFQVPEPTPTPIPTATPIPPPFAGFLEGSGCGFSLIPATAGSSAGMLWMALGLMAGFLGFRKFKK